MKEQHLNSQHFIPLTILNGTQIRIDSPTGYRRSVGILPSDTRSGAEQVEREPALFGTGDELGPELCTSAPKRAAFIYSPALVSLTDITLTI